MKYLPLLLCTLCLLSCDSAQDERLREPLKKVAEVQRNVEQLVGETHQLLKGMAPTVQPADLSKESAVAEVNKLRQFEYKVISLPLNSDARAIENALNNAGQEYWECFSAFNRPNTNALEVYCRRRPNTPLRFVPQTLLGR